MTMRRLVLAFVIALVAQGAVFAWRYSDLLYLRLPPVELAAGDTARFRAAADEALERRDLTRGHLDTIASTAARLQQHALEVRALERRLERDPEDVGVQLRLAEACRRAGALARAEALYLGVLEHEGSRLP